MDEREINSAAKRMKERLNILGYINAEVTPTITQIDTNNIHIDFNVYSGKAYSITKYLYCTRKISVLNQSKRVGFFYNDSELFFSWEFIL